MILAEEQEMIRDSVRAYAREQLAPHAAQWDREATFPREALAGLGRMGLFGVAVAQEWGGAGLNYLALALAMEEIAAGDGASATIIAVNNLVTGILNGFATPAQREQLPEAARQRRAAGLLLPHRAARRLGRVRNPYQRAARRRATGC